MKRILLVAALLSVSGCGGQSLYLTTSPGSALPGGLIAHCGEHDAVGRCKKWMPEGDKCINPKGINVEPPLVWCNYIKDGMLQDKPVDGNYHDK